MGWLARQQARLEAVTNGSVETTVADRVAARMRAPPRRVILEELSEGS
jgi:hypothetical protein